MEAANGKKTGQSDEFRGDDRQDFEGVNGTPKAAETQRLPHSVEAVGNRSGSRTCGRKADGKQVLPEPKILRGRLAEERLALFNEAVARQKCN